MKHTKNTHAISYLHNVAIEREAISSSKDNLVTTGALEDGNHLSITSIISKALNVKVINKKSPAEYDGQIRLPGSVRRC